MRNWIGKSALGLALASMTALTAGPADAQYYRHHNRHHDDDAAWAIGAGILGLGVGAAIASSNRNRYYGNGYYNDGYYNSGYYDRGYYGRGYYGGGAYGRGYARCAPHWVWDDYYRQWIRVRGC